MKKTFIILLCLALAHTSANAQTFLDDLRTDKANQGHVTVEQSKDIDVLVNGVQEPRQAEKPEHEEGKRPNRSRRHRTRTSFRLMLLRPVRHHLSAMTSTKKTS